LQSASSHVFFEQIQRTLQLEVENLRAESAQDAFKLVGTCKDVLVIVTVRIPPVPLLPLAERAPLREVAQAAASGNVHSPMNCRGVVRSGTAAQARLAIQAKFEARRGAKPLFLEV